ncbi:MAG TPA: hypothetical protein VF572_05310 [Candidatus Saccharimonadales bacterium]|jgi:hypothetical protein
MANQEGIDDGNLPGIPVDEHYMLSIDEQGSTRWAAGSLTSKRLGRIAKPGIIVDGARGFNTTEEIEEFTEQGGKLVLPMSIDFDADPVQPTLFARQEARIVYGVRFPRQDEGVTTHYAGLADQPNSVDEAVLLDSFLNGLRRR